MRHSEPPTIRRHPGGAIDVSHCMILARQSRSKQARKMAKGILAKRRFSVLRAWPFRTLRNWPASIGVRFSLPNKRA
jgi:hypothetical protein